MPQAAGQLLDQGAALLEAGDFPEAFATYQRVVGFDDPEVTAAALLGMAQARYRMDDEDWRGPDLGGDPRAARDDVDLSRLAERRGGAGPRRRPERGDRRLSRGRPTGARGRQARDRQPARLAGEGDRQRPGVAALLRPRPRQSSCRTRRTRSSGSTVASRSPRRSPPMGGPIYDALQLDKRAVAAGEIWRLRDGRPSSSDPERGCVHLLHLALQHVRAVSRRARSSSGCTARR